MWSRGIGIAFLAMMAVVFMLGHQHVPNRPGNLGSLLETFLPWLGLSIPLLLAAAIWRRSATGAIAVAATTLVWIALFGHLLVPGKGGGEADLRVLSHNVEASNPDPQGTADALMAAEPDIIALQELSETNQGKFSAALRTRYPHYYAEGTIALYSRHPLLSAETVDIGMGWTRAMRVEADTPAGPVAVYVAHLASVRIGSDGFTSSHRNTTIDLLAERIAGERHSRVIVMGDLNGTAYDRGLAPLTFGLASAQAQAGWGFGFSWPAGFPMARIDHILLRGVTATDSWVLPATASDHRPVVADLRLNP